MSVASSQSTSSGVIRILTSSLGRKFIMALTGTGLFVFLCGHLAGNMLLFVGQDALNTYAAQLKALPALIWGARLGLLLFLSLHVLSGVSLWWENQGARPQNYARLDSLHTGVSAKTMFWSGLALFLFVAYHLAHFTLLWVNPSWGNLVDHLGRPDVYSMVILGFRSIVVAGLYVAAMICLGTHLFHGLASLFQSLGVNEARVNPILRFLGPAIAVVLVIGFLALPLAVQFGLLELPPGVIG